MSKRIKVITGVGLCILLVLGGTAYYMPTLSHFIIASHFERILNAERVAGAIHTLERQKDDYEKYPFFMREHFENILKEQLTSDSTNERSEALRVLKRLSRFYPEWRYNSIIGYRKESASPQDQLNLCTRYEAFVEDSELGSRGVVPTERALANIDFLLHGLN